MEEQYFLIYVGDSNDNCVIGLVVGTEEDAEKFCETHPPKYKPWQDIWYAETEILNTKESVK